MATRLYLETGPVPPVSPAFDAAWNITAAADRSVTAPAKRVTTQASLTATKAIAGPTNLLRKQLVSPPLSGAQTITGTIKGQIRVLQSNVGADAKAQVVVRVVSGDGLTVRGTLLAADASVLSSEFVTAATNRKFPLAAVSPATLTSVAAQDGDRIVVEIGARVHEAGTTSRTITWLLGTSAGTDAPENETTTTAIDPWVEFSQTLTFVTQASVAAVAAQVLIKTVGHARVGSVGVQVLIGAAVAGPTFDGWGIPI